MPIKKCSDHSHKTLKEFYTEVSTWPNQFGEISRKMISFVDLINDTFKETQLWSHTSHTNLVIQNKDLTCSERLVIVQNVGLEQYYFSYLLPKRKRAWEYARVHGGEAANIHEAKKYLLIAMRESEGWKGNLEFERLLEENGLNQTKSE